MNSGKYMFVHAMIAVMVGIGYGTAWCAEAATNELRLVSFHRFGPAQDELGEWERDLYVVPAGKTLVVTQIHSIVDSVDVNQDAESGNVIAIKARPRQYLWEIKPGGGTEQKTRFHMLGYEQQTPYWPGLVFGPGSTVRLHVEGLGSSWVTVSGFELNNPNGILADLNRDGHVDAQDVLLMQNDWGKRN